MFLITSKITHLGAEHSKVNNSKMAHPKNPQVMHAPLKEKGRN